MKIIIGAVLIFGAAWLMYRLQAGGSSCCGSNFDSSGPDSEIGQCCSGTAEKAVKGEGVASDINKGAQKPGERSGR